MDGLSAVPVNTAAMGTAEHGGLGAPRNGDRKQGGSCSPASPQAPPQQDEGAGASDSQHAGQGEARP